MVLNCPFSFNKLSGESGDAELVPSVRILNTYYFEANSSTHQKAISIPATTNEYRTVILAIWITPRLRTINISSPALIKNLRRIDGIPNTVVNSSTLASSFHLYAFETTNNASATSLTVSITFMNKSTTATANSDMSRWALFEITNMINPQLVNTPWPFVFSNNTVTMNPAFIEISGINYPKNSVILTVPMWRAMTGYVDTRNMNLSGSLGDLLSQTYSIPNYASGGQNRIITGCGTMYGAGSGTIRYTWPLATALSQIRVFPIMIFKGE